MNNERRKKIEQITTKLSELQGEVEELKDEEQEIFDNMPENFQSGEKGEAAQTAIDSLEQSAEMLGEVIGYLETAAE